MNAFMNALKGVTFLVVDDEPDNVGVVTRLLKMMGGQVTVAEDGKKGLETARSSKPMVIFADLSMPVMSGWQMLYEIKKDAALQAIPVIALTAHAMSGDRERVLNAGFAGYIAKPIDVPVFMPHVTHMIKELPQLSMHFNDAVMEAQL